MLDSLGRVEPEVNPYLGRARNIISRYDPEGMGNGLRALREKARMSLDQAASALGLTKSGYTKIERGERGLKSDFIRRACEVFGASPEAVIGDLGADGMFIQEIDQEKLATLILLAKERLGSLPEAEARNLILALISASRRPTGLSGGR
jgi:transcriptional regulator with XRE-family HTH domain